MTQKYLLNKIEQDKEIYPRTNISRITVDSYVEALKAGAQFPPITVQLIVDNNDREYVICLDGWHRVLAYKEQGETKIDVVLWKQEKLGRKENLIDLMLISAKLNTQHGDRLRSKDCQAQAQKIVELDFKYSGKKLAESFGVTDDTISSWTSAIRARHQASENAFVYRLSLLGRNNRELAKILKITEQAIGQKLKQIEKSRFTLVSDYQKGKSIEEIAKHYELGIPLVWSIILDGKTDLERFNLFHENPPSPFNVWMFADRDPRLGIIATGNIPGQIVTHLLYYYTKQGDSVLDPMGGGGSTLDACLIMNRKCRGYDKNPNKERPDIIDHDFTEGAPSTEKYDLVFFDPPYYNMVFDFYKNIDEFYEFISKCADYALEVLKPGGHVAFLIQDMTEKGTYCLSGESYKIFSKKFEYVDHISAPLTSNVESRARVDGERKLVGRNRDMYVFRRA